MINQIDDFRNDYEFLSNGFPCNIEFDGEIYASLEHAFQAAKTNDFSVRESIKNATTSADAKHIGRNVLLVSDWDNQRLDIMADLVRQKFTNNLDLKIKLLMTGSKDLVQGGMWRDQFWGVDKNGIGENNLGKILMKIRDSIRASEGGPEQILSVFLEKNGLELMAESIKNILKQAKSVVNFYKTTNQTSNELESLENAVMVLE